MAGNKPTGCCLACGGDLTKENRSRLNEAFHMVCMNEGVDVPLEVNKYKAEELRHTWAESTLNQRTAEPGAAAKTDVKA